MRGSMMRNVRAQDWRGDGGPCTAACARSAILAVARCGGAMRRWAGRARGWCPIRPSSVAAGREGKHAA